MQLNQLPFHCFSYLHPVQLWLMVIDLIDSACLFFVFCFFYSIEEWWRLSFFVACFVHIILFDSTLASCIKQFIRVCVFYFRIKAEPICYCNTECMHHNTCVSMECFTSASMHNTNSVGPVFCITVTLCTLPQFQELSSNLPLHIRIRTTVKLCTG